MCRMLRMAHLSGVDPLWRERRRTYPDIGYKLDKGEFEGAAVAFSHTWTASLTGTEGAQPYTRSNARRGPETLAGVVMRRGTSPGTRRGHWHGDPRNPSIEGRTRAVTRLPPFCTPSPPPARVPWS